MATDPGFAAYVVEQAGDAGDVVARRMFGEYGLYLDGIMVALLCDDQCFLKPTDAARALLDEVVEGAPYPNAKPHLLLGPELEDRARLAELLRRTAQALPPPKPRKPRRRRGAASGGEEP